jgi:hypothetical protein
MSRIGLTSPPTPVTTPTPPPQVRSATVALPLLVVGSTDVAVTWSPDLPSAVYMVSFVKPAALLGKSDVSVKPGSQVVGGCTVSVSNTSLASLSAGASLTVTVFHAGS